MRLALALTVAFGLMLTSPVAARDKSGPQAAKAAKPADTASALRGTGNNNRKGGRYLAGAGLRKLPGTKKPPTLTLKRGRNAE